MWMGHSPLWFAGCDRPNAEWGFGSWGGVNSANNFFARECEQRNRVRRCQGRRAKITGSGACPAQFTSGNEEVVNNMFSAIQLGLDNFSNLQLGFSGRRMRRSSRWDGFRSWKAWAAEARRLQLKWYGEGRLVFQQLIRLTGDLSIMRQRSLGGLRFMCGRLVRARGSGLFQIKAAGCQPGGVA